MKFKKGTLATVFTVAALVSGAGFGIYELEGTVPPASAGVTYLEDHGFTNVQTTGQSFLQSSLSCRKGEEARSYMATNQDGQRVKETLCFGVFGHIRKP